MAQERKNITTKTTTNFVSRDCFLFGVVIAPTSIGTGWTFTVKDKDSPAAVIIPPITFAAAPGKDEDFQFFPRWGVPVFMKGGVDVVTGGTTAGDAWVWVIYEPYSS